MLSPAAFHWLANAIGYARPPLAVLAAHAPSGQARTIASPPQSPATAVGMPARRMPRGSLLDIFV